MIPRKLPKLDPWGFGPYYCTMCRDEGRKGKETWTEAHSVFLLDLGAVNRKAASVCIKRGDALEQGLLLPIKGTKLMDGVNEQKLDEMLRDIAYGQCAPSGHSVTYSISLNSSRPRGMVSTK